MEQIERDWQAAIIIVALTMSRMLVAFSIVPLFVGNGVPALIRIVIVAGLSLALLPLAFADTALAALPMASLPFYVAKEAALGLVLGLIASTGFWALYVAGAIIEFQAGLAFSSTVDPLSGQPESLIGTLLMRLFTMLFLVSGGLLALISMLFESYLLWPLSSLVPAVGNVRLIEVLLGAFAGLLAVALKVAAPFVILMLMIEMALGFLSRFAPVLNVFFIALPMKILALNLMLLLYGMMLATGGSLLPLADFSTVLASLEEAFR